MDGLKPPVRIARRTWRVLISAYFLMLAAAAAAVIPVLVETNVTLDREQGTFDPAISSSAMLLIGALNQETGIRGYSLTGQTSYLQPYQLGVAQYSSAAKELNRIDIGPSYRTDLQATESAFSDWHAVAVEIVSDARTQGRVRQAALLEQANGKKDFDTFRSKQAALSSEIASATNADRTSLHDRVTTSLLLSSAVIVFGAVLGFVIFAWWRRYGRNADLAQQRLQEQSRLAQAAIDVTSDSVFVKDLEGRHVLANKARVTSLTGGTVASEVIGHPVDEFVSPEVAEVVKLNEAEVYRTGQPRRFEETLVVNGDPRHYAVTKNPLRNEEGDLIGVVGVARDVTEDLAHVAEMERLYGVERDIARRLQDSMLGNNRIEDSRIEVSTFYQPAMAETFIGGDWYDVLPIGDDAAALLIGDVVGHGMDAIAAMGQLRSAMSALAYSNEPPNDTLEVLETFARTVPQAHFATCLFARLDLAGKVMQYSSAGHMPMMVLEPDGSARLLDSAQDPPLVAQFPGRRRSTSLQLSRGSVVLQFTDGLVEKRGELIDVGLARLMAALRSHADLPVEEMCNQLAADMVPAGGHGDDIAIVVARIT